MFRKRLFGLITVFLAVFIATIALGVDATNTQAYDGKLIGPLDGPIDGPIDGLFSGSIISVDIIISEEPISQSPVAPPPPPPPPDPTWDPGDERLNPDMAAPVALLAKNGIFSAFDAQTKQELVHISAADLVCAEEAVVVESVAGTYPVTVSCYPGGFSVMVDKGTEMVVYLFDGVPPTTMITQVYQDGVLTGEKTRVF